MISEHQHEVIQWAKALVNQDPVILDTETTGLYDGEICQIAIVDFEGNVLVDTLVKPHLPIPPDATRIHGITNAMVESAAPWLHVSYAVQEVIRQREVVVYNASYDRRMMYQSTARQPLGVRVEWSDLASWHCAMERYAEYYGDWNEYRGNYRWQKLTDACRQCGIPDPDAPAHSALGDALRTLALVQCLASKGV